MLPMMPNWSRFSGLTSGLAPMSSTTHEPVAVGNITARAGRSTPRMRPRRNSAVTMAAPVFPAVTKASASPFLTRSMPTAMEFCASLCRAFICHGEHLGGVHDADRKAPRLLGLQHGPHPGLIAHQDDLHAVLARR